MKIGDFVTGTGAILFALFIFYETRDFPPARGGELGPAFFLRLIAVFLIIMGCIVLYRALATRREGRKIKIGLNEIKNAVTTAGFRNVAVTILATLIYMVVLGHLSFIPATMLFLFIVMKALGVSIVKSLIFSPCITMFIFGLFSLLLKVVLP